MKHKCYLWFSIHCYDYFPLDDYERIEYVAGPTLLSQAVSHPLGASGCELNKVGQKRTSVTSDLWAATKCLENDVCNETG